MLAGFITGLGAALADAIYGYIAALGATALKVFLLSHEMILRVAGGLFLFLFGLILFCKKETPIVSPFPQNTSLYSSLATFTLAMTSPMTMLTFVGVFITLDIQFHEVQILNSLKIILGVFLGSTLWWLILSAVASLLKDKINIASFSRINQIAGSLLLLFGSITLLLLLY